MWRLPPMCSTPATISRVRHPSFLMISGCCMYLVAMRNVRGMSERQSRLLTHSFICDFSVDGIHACMAMHNDIFVSPFAIPSLLQGQVFASWQLVPA